MRALVQRVSESRVKVENRVIAEIGPGMLILLGIEHSDTPNDIEWLTRKIGQLRIFPDDENRMNRSITDINGHILLISQFTLYASTKKGNRPSFTKAAKPEQAIPLYNEMIRSLEAAIGREISVGQFGADMKVQLTNDGPVTILIDSKYRE
ncbi:MAG: D-aminoacyl-tRNA deacylase [Saprospiraceae bacterium]|nr:D-aminoacyl-tRNA deacylase [Saprospiraceae bacterium]